MCDKFKKNTEHLENTVFEVNLCAKFHLFPIEKKVNAQQGLNVQKSGGLPSNNKKRRQQNGYWFTFVIHMSV